MYSKDMIIPVWFQLNYTSVCSGLLSKVCMECWIMHKFLSFNMRLEVISSVAEDSGKLGCDDVLLCA